MYAVRDHDMFSYIKSHPEDFPEKDKKTYREVFNNSIQCVEVSKTLAPVSSIPVISVFCQTVSMI